jgi:subtilisin family serine protease
MQQKGTDMTSEEGKMIYSNDYADLIVSTPGAQDVLKRLGNGWIQTIDNFFSVIRIPISEHSDSIMKAFNYIIVPSIFGLVSQTSLEASGITKTRMIPGLDLKGEGVLIGIIDSGIDYLNPIFRKEDNTTKIVSIWDQTIHTEDFISNTFYGTEYTREQINQALKSDSPFDIVPSKDEVGHGTMVAAIAAGNEVPDNNFYGIAPSAELVVVKLKPAKKYLKEFWKIPEDAICYQLNDIEAGLEYLEQASIRLNRPISICLSLGSSQGSHKGKSLFSKAVTARAENLNFSIQVAAGNEGNAKRHYFGSIDPVKRINTVELKVGEEERGFVLELWGASPGLYSLDIRAPSGEFIPRVIPRFNQHYPISFIFESTLVQIDYQVVESQSGDQLILFRFTNPSTGIWSFQVYGSGELNLNFHMWLPMEGFISKDTYFLNADPYTTILSPGNSLGPITVTAYDSNRNSLYQRASLGYTRDGNIKPDIAAPGVNIVSPDLSKGFLEASGTSLAAAHATGVAALLMEWCIVKGNLPIINTADIKTLMIRGARRDSNIAYPNREWGYGVLDVYNILNSFRRST